VPSGGIRAGWIGAIEGGGSMQIVAGQIGGMSIELLQSGCISPSTQRHWQEASARAVNASPKITASTIRIAVSFNCRRSH
jgi:hypothetical protein